MFGKPDSRDAEIAFLREQVKTLQDKLVALADARAAALLQQGQRGPHIPGPPAPVRLAGPQAIREAGVRLVDGQMVSDMDKHINESFDIR